MTLEQGVRAIHVRVRAVVIAGIALVSVLHMVFSWPPRGTYARALVEMFDVDRERNVPTWFSSAEILLLSLLFFAIAFHETSTRRRRRATAFWLTCGAAAAFLSMDEAATIHEAVGDLAGDFFKSSTPGTFAYYLGTFPSYYWALVYVPLAVPPAIAFGWFALKEMVGTRALAISGLVVYGLGAVVLDHLEGRYGNSNHERILLGQSFLFDPFLVEELFEMLGVLMLLEAGFRHLQHLAAARAPPEPP